MRFVTFATTGSTEPAWALDRDRGTRVGVQRPDGTIHALAPGLRLVDLLGDLVAAGASTPSEVFATADVRLLPPVPAPPSVRDFMTFEQHVAGAVRNRDPAATVAPAWYEIPTFYFSNPAGLIGAHDPVPMPPGCERLDLELE
ncbi:MAG: hydroxylase, partial [Actinomycetota bacterium]